MQNLHDEEEKLQNYTNEEESGSAVVGEQTIRLRGVMVLVVLFGIEEIV
jgi:hypothetical protein